MRLVPHEIARALRDGDDRDLLLDLSVLIARLPDDAQKFLRLYGEGYSPHAAVEKMGLRKNAQQWFDSLVRHLTQEVNE